MKVFLFSMDVCNVDEYGLFLFHFHMQIIDLMNENDEVMMQMFFFVFHAM